MTKPIIIDKIDLIKDFSRMKKMAGKKIALVPTMGALHDGHLSLIKIAKQKSDIVMASIYVNPKQFSKGEDLERYPQPLQQDIAKLEKMAVDVIYTPTTAEIYPDDFSTYIHVGALEKILCGQFRPHHFAGVATIVAKLFLQTEPDVAIFGEKDFQQLMVIKKMVKDLNFTIEIIGAPTMREESGLAMSSRNQYLTDGEKKIAPLLYQTLVATKERILAGESSKRALALGKEELLAGGFSKVDYLEWRKENDLSLMVDGDGGASRLLVAAHLGKARLLDNIFCSSLSLT